MGKGAGIFKYNRGLPLHVTTYISLEPQDGGLVDRDRLRVENGREQKDKRLGLTAFEQKLARASEAGAPTCLGLHSTATVHKFKHA
jgi:hypothetical protein